VRVVVVVAAKRTGLERMRMNAWPTKSGTDGTRDIRLPDAPRPGEPNGATKPSAGERAAGGTRSTAPASSEPVAGGGGSATLLHASTLSSRSSGASAVAQAISRRQRNVRAPSSASVE
jgi:hypothetical protein